MAANSRRDYSAQRSIHALLHVVFLDCSALRSIHALLHVLFLDCSALRSIHALFHVLFLDCSALRSIHALLHVLFLHNVLDRNSAAALCLYAVLRTVTYQLEQSLCKDLEGGGRILRGGGDDSNFVMKKLVTLTFWLGRDICLSVDVELGAGLKQTSQRVCSLRFGA